VSWTSLAEATPCHLSIVCSIADAHFPRHSSPPYARAASQPHARLTKSLELLVSDQDIPFSLLFPRQRRRPTPYRSSIESGRIGAAAIAATYWHCRLPSVAASPSRRHGRSLQSEISTGPGYQLLCQSPRNRGRWLRSAQCDPNEDKSHPGRRIPRYATLHPLEETVFMSLICCHI
jgi:hypothetical protein